MSQPNITARPELLDHLTALLLRGPLVNRFKSSKPIKIKVENGRVGDWTLWQVIDALGWLAGPLHKIDGFDARKPNTLGYITVYPKGSLAAAA